MTSFRYRAATATGQLRAGVTDAASLQGAIDRLRGEGLRPIETVAVRTAPARGRVRTLPGRFTAKLFSELAVMLDAGIALDRALLVAQGSADDRRTGEVLSQVHERLRGGSPFSQALADCGGAFPPLAAAMAAAGEADGRPGPALARLGATLARAQALRDTLSAAAVYPAMLVAIAAGVTALMLFWVVPQFEGLFSEGEAHLPAVTRGVLEASRIARHDGALIALGLLGVGVALWRVSRNPALRRSLDRQSLALPWFGKLITYAELARFFRVLGSLSEGGVPLPEALALARRSLVNTHIAQAVERVTVGLREGAELTGPLAATGVLPQIAVSYLLTGQESAQLPLMLSRLADVLDADLRTGVERTVAIMTPAITVALGAFVATVIASVMTAILGFNDLAIAP